MIRVLLVAVLGLALALGWSLWRAEVHKGDAEAANTRATQAEQAAEDALNTLTAERAAAVKLDTIGEKHEEDRRDAESVPGAVDAALRAGTLQLRKQWAACETSLLSATAASAAERDALAELRRKDQGDLVRVGRDADDHARACQAVIRADREENP